MEVQYMFRKCWIRSWINLITIKLTSVLDMSFWSWSMLSCACAMPARLGLIDIIHSVETIIWMSLKVCFFFNFISFFFLLPIFLCSLVFFLRLFLMSNLQRVIDFDDASNLLYQWNHPKCLLEIPFILIEILAVLCVAFFWTNQGLLPFTCSRNWVFKLSKNWLLLTGCYIYSPKDFAGWYGLGLYLHYSRAIFCCWSSFGEHGVCTSWTALIAFAKAYHQMLSSIVRQSKVGANGLYIFSHDLIIIFLLFCWALLFVLILFWSLFCRACDALRSCLPDMLRDATFSSCLRVSVFFNAFPLVLAFMYFGCYPH